MIKLKPSVLVSAMAFAYFSLNAAVHHQRNISLPSQLNTQQLEPFAQSAHRSANIVKQSTVSGLRNQFDSSLERATFVWRSKNQKKPDLSKVEPANRARVASDFYLRQLTGSGARNSGITTDLKYISDKKFGPIIAKYKQEIQGIEVFNKEYNIMLDQDYNLVAGSGYLTQTLSVHKARNLVQKFELASAEEAVEIAFSQLSDGAANIAINKAEQRGKYQWFDAKSENDAYQVIGQPRAKRVFYEQKSHPTAAYYVEIQLAEQGSLDSRYYSFVIDAETSNVLFSKNLKAHLTDFSYRVYAKPSGHPMQGPHGSVLPKIDKAQPDRSDIEQAPLMSISHYASLTTQDPWLADDATTTSGNNVIAYSDVVAPDGLSYGDILPSTTSDKTFDYQLDIAQLGNSIHNRKAAAVNMFYMNNFMHDFYYDYGFDEAAGNAQQDNYERGGLGGDPLHAEAQDNSGLNNANMMTPADGASPRMQQYLYISKDSNGDEDFGVTSPHPSIGVLQSAKLASFGPRQFQIPETQIQRAYDTSVNDSTTDACETLTNSTETHDSLVGKVAIIDRGKCDFIDKVKNVELAGAIAAIIVNNIDDGTPPRMGGKGRKIVIPSIGISYEEGQQGSQYSLSCSPSFH